MSSPSDPWIESGAYLANVVAVIRERGFVPGTAADEQPTWRAALERLELGAEVAPADLARAHQVLGWVASLKPRNDDCYRARIVACLAHEQLTMRDLPLAASAVHTFNRHLYYEIRGRRTSKPVRGRRAAGITPTA